MKNLSQYIEESLLDDLDDLVQKTDDLFIQNRYKIKEVNYHVENSALNHNKLNGLDDSGKYKVYRITGDASESDIRKIVNYIMSLPLTDNDLEKIEYDRRQYDSKTFNIDFFNIPMEFKFQSKGFGKFKKYDCISVSNNWPYITSISIRLIKK